MNKYIMCFMLLCIGICLYADGTDKPRSTNYSKAQMDKLAEQYKAASGFTGTIRYDLNQGSFTKIAGRLPNLSVSDTTSAKAAALKLLSPLKSFMKINPAQLEHWEVKPDNQLSYSYYVIGYQRINGLEFEDSKGILFRFIKSNPGFVEVSNTFVPDLNFSTKNLISEAKAKEIYQKQPGKSDLIVTASILVICPIKKNGIDGPIVYRPCWVIIANEKNPETQLHYVDAETGSILMNKAALKKYNTSYTVTGDTYFADGVAVTTPTIQHETPLPDVIVSSTTGIERATNDEGVAIFNNDNVSASAYLESQLFEIKWFWYESFNGNHNTRRITATAAIDNPLHLNFLNHSLSNESTIDDYSPNVYYNMSKFKQYMTQNVLATSPQLIHVETNVPSDIIHPERLADFVYLHAATYDSYSIYFYDINSNVVPKYPFIIRHEHAHAYSAKNFHGALNSTGNLAYDSMDEGIANYYACKSACTDYMLAPNSAGQATSQSISNSSNTNDAIAVFGANLSEEDYSKYKAGITLPAIWNGIRPIN